MAIKTRTRSSDAFSTWWAQRERTRHRRMVVFDEIMAAWNAALDFASKLPKHERNGNLMFYKCWLNEDIEKQMEMWVESIKKHHELTGDE